VSDVEKHHVQKVIHIMNHNSPAVCVGLVTISSDILQESSSALCYVVYRESFGSTPSDLPELTETTA
jgi:hypothetical protein